MPNNFCQATLLGFPDGAVVQDPPANAGDMGSIPGLGRSPGEGNGIPLRILAWRIPWTEEPGGLQSVGSQRVGHDSVTEHTSLLDTSKEHFLI